jgi:hypothetical protein
MLATTVGTFLSTSLAASMSAREDGRWTKEEEVTKRDLLFYVSLVAWERCR